MVCRSCGKSLPPKAALVSVASMQIAHLRAGQETANVAGALSPSTNHDFAESSRTIEDGQADAAAKSLLVIDSSTCDDPLNRCMTSIADLNTIPLNRLRRVTQTSRTIQRNRALLSRARPPSR